MAGLEGYGPIAMRIGVSSHVKVESVPPQPLAEMKLSRTLTGTCGCLVHSMIRGSKQQAVEPKAPTEISYPPFLRHLPHNAVSLSIHARPGAKVDWCMVCSAVLNAALMPLPEAALLLQACTVSMTHDTLSIAVNVPARCTHAHAVTMDAKRRNLHAIMHPCLPSLRP